MTKVATPTRNGWSNQPPPLSLVPAKPEKKDDTKTASFKLRTNPADADSDKYQFTMNYLTGDEDVRTAIQFVKDFLKVCGGLNITTGDAANNLAEELLRGTAASAYRKGILVQRHAQRNSLEHAAVQASPAAATGEEKQQARTGVVLPGLSTQQVQLALREVITFMAPHKALTKQKRWMRRVCRKPADMSTRQYANHLMRINTEELHFLPPFQPNQFLPDDEMVDILLNGIPNAWKKEMNRQDYDPDMKSLMDVVAFCERMEEAEDFTPVTTSNNSSKKTSSIPRKTPKHSDAMKYCLVHGKNMSHNSDGCHMLKEFADNKKSGYASGHKRKPESRNKTWSRKADENKKKAKGELKAMDDSSVRDIIREELNAFSKKRASVESDSDDMSDGEINNVDFSKVNFNDDGKIDLGDGDSISIDSKSAEA
jgi:hypothetical protein